MSPKLNSWLTVLAVLAGVPAVLAQPTLGIAPAGGQSVLYWSTTPTNYILQSATNLATPNWVTANDAVPVTATTVSNTLPARFFRADLHQPARRHGVDSGGLVHDGELNW